MTATLEPYVDDPATQRWVKQAWQPEVPPTRDELLTYAQRRIAALTKADASRDALGWQPVSGAVASFAMALLNTVVDGDGRATPQVAPTKDGGLDIQWLVSGDSLEITVDLHDGISIVGRYDNGEYAISPVDWTFDEDAERLHVAVHSAREFLGKISTGIQHRVPIR